MLLRRLALLILVPTLAFAQLPKRRLEGELTGNAFFGSTRQVLASVRGEHERSDSAFSIRTQLRFNYGQAKTDVVGTVVIKRSWSASAEYGWRPFGDFSPLVRATLESSFENKIDRRFSLLVGSRVNLYSAPNREVVYRMGVAGERTTSLPPGNASGAVTLSRGSMSLRLRNDFSDRVSLISETAYQPAVLQLQDYTFGSLSTLRIKMASFAALTFAFRDNYDNGAVFRGATSNNDGEITLGLLTTF